MLRLTTATGFEPAAAWNARCPEGMPSGGPESSSAAVRWVHAAKDAGGGAMASRRPGGGTDGAGSGGGFGRERPDPGATMAGQSFRNTFADGGFRPGGSKCRQPVPALERLPAPAGPVIAVFSRT